MFLKRFRKFDDTRNYFDTPKYAIGSNHADTPKLAKAPKYADAPKIIKTFLFQNRQFRLEKFTIEKRPGVCETRRQWLSTNVIGK